MILWAPAPAATAETRTGQARVRVTHFGAPVYNAPLELIDLRSGEVIATAKTGDDGIAVFENLPASIVFEAQTPNGRFTSPPFRAEETVELALTHEAAPPALWGVAAEGSLGFGSARVSADIDDQDRQFVDYNRIADPTTDSSQGTSYGGGRLQIAGPSLTSLGIRPLLEGGYEVPLDPYGAGATARGQIDNSTFNHQMDFDWEAGNRWELAAGLRAPVPNPWVETEAELLVGFARQELDFRGQAVHSGGFASNVDVVAIDEKDLDFVTVRAAIPLTLWRKGGFSARLVVGGRAAVPLGGGKREAIAVTNASSSFGPGRVMVRSEFEPGIEIGGFLALRVQFDHFRLPSVR